MDTLVDILKEFDKNRTRNTDSISKDYSADQIYHEDNDKEVAKWAQPVAEKLLYNGHFELNGKYIIELEELELYYHEEDGPIKDPIMYHTNSRMLFVPYFKIGTLHPHVSGIDITFENNDNPTDRYRASFLIRAYRFYEKGQTRPKIDNCSTHLYDDLFIDGLPWGNTALDLKWVPQETPGNFPNLKPDNRVNVPKYKVVKDKKGNLRYEKIEKPESTPRKKIYESCPRQWRFIKQSRN